MTDSCIRCGCKGEFKNSDTGDFYVMTGYIGICNDAGFLRSERTCFCSTCPKGDGEKGCESLASRKKRNSAEHPYIAERLSRLVKGDHVSLGYFQAMLDQDINDYMLHCENVMTYTPVAAECKRLLQENGPTLPHVCSLPNSKAMCLDGKCCAAEMVKFSKLTSDMLEPELDICQNVYKFAKRMFEQNDAVTAKAKITEAIVVSQGKTFAETLIFWANQ